MNLIRIKTFEKVSKELETTSPYFEKSYISGNVTNILAREFGTTIFVFENANVDIKQRIKNEIALVKNSP